MNKPLIRLIALLLLPCLLADPATVSAFTPSFAPSNQSLIVKNDGALFGDQALAEHALSPLRVIGHLTFWSIMLAASVGLNYLTVLAQGRQTPPAHHATQVDVSAKTNEEQALYRRLTNNTLQFQSSNEAIYRRGEPAAISRDVLKYRTDFERLYEHKNKPATEHLPSALPEKPVAIEALQRHLWISLRATAKEPTLRKALSQPYTPDRFNEFLWWTLPTYLARHGISVQFTEVAHVDSAGMVRRITTLPFLFEIVSVEDVSLDPDQAKALTERGVRVDQLVILGAQLGPGLARIDPPSELPPAWNQYNTVFWQQGELERSIQRGQEYFAKVLRNMYPNGIPDPPMSFSVDRDKLRRAAKDSEQAAILGIEALGYLMVYNRVDSDIAEDVRSESSGHEVGHILQQHDPEERLEKATALTLPLQVDDYDRRQFSRSVHREIAAGIAELRAGLREDAAFEVFSHAVTRYRAPVSAEDHHSLAEAWIYDRVLRLILDSKRGGPERFKMTIDKESPLSPRDQVALQIFLLVLAQNKTPYAQLLQDLEQEHINNYEFLFLPEMNKNPMPTFETVPPATRSSTGTFKNKRKKKGPDTAASLLTREEKSHLNFLKVSYQPRGRDERIRYRQMLRPLNPSVATPPQSSDHSIKLETAESKGSPPDFVRLPDFLSNNQYLNSIPELREMHFPRVQPISQLESGHVMDIHAVIRQYAQFAAVPDEALVKLLQTDERTVHVIKGDPKAFARRVLGLEAQIPKETMGYTFSYQHPIESETESNKPPNTEYFIVLDPKVFDDRVELAVVLGHEYIGHVARAPVPEDIANQSTEEFLKWIVGHDELAPFSSHDLESLRTHLRQLHKLPAAPLRRPPDPTRYPAFLKTDPVPWILKDGTPPQPFGTVSNSPWGRLLLECLSGGTKLDDLILEPEIRSMIVLYPFLTQLIERRDLEALRKYIHFVIAPIQETSNLLIEPAIELMGTVSAMMFSSDEEAWQYIQNEVWRIVLNAAEKHRSAFFQGSTMLKQLYDDEVLTFAHDMMGRTEELQKYLFQYGWKSPADENQKVLELVNVALNLIAMHRRYNQSVYERAPGFAGKPFATAPDSKDFSKDYEYGSVYEAAGALTDAYGGHQMWDTVILRVIRWWKKNPDDHAEFRNMLKTGKAKDIRTQFYAVLLQWIESHPSDDLMVPGIEILLALRIIDPKLPSVAGSEGSGGAWGKVAILSGELESAQGEPVRVHLTVKDLDVQGVATGTSQDFHLPVSEPYVRELRTIGNQVEAFQKAAEERSKSIAVPAIYRGIFKNFAQSLWVPDLLMLRGILPLRRGSFQPYFKSFTLGIVSFLPEESLKDPTITLHEIFEAWLPEYFKFLPFEMGTTVDHQPYVVIGKDKIFIHKLIRGFGKKARAIGVPTTEQDQALVNLGDLFGRGLADYLLSPEFGSPLKYPYEETAMKDKGPSAGPGQSQTERGPLGEEELDLLYRWKEQEYLPFKSVVKHLLNLERHGLYVQFNEDTAITRALGASKALSPKKWASQEPDPPGGVYQLDTKIDGNVAYIRISRLHQAHRPVRSLAVMGDGILLGLGVWPFLSRHEIALAYLVTMFLWHAVKAIVGIYTNRGKGLRGWAAITEAAAGFDRHSGERWGPTLLRETEEYSHELLDGLLRAFGVETETMPRWVVEVPLEIPEILGLDLLVGVAHLLKRPVRPLTPTLVRRAA